MTLKTIHVPGVGPYVCGRKKSDGNAFPRFEGAPFQSFNDVDAIRAAAKTMLPIYQAIENIDGNDRFGCCTSVAAHKIQVIFDCAVGLQWRPPSLDDILWTYSQTTNPPFNPKTGANDNGADLGTVLNFWQKHGLFQNGYGKIKTAYAVDATKPDEVKSALNATGVLYAACDLPKDWEQISGTGFTWGMAGPPDPEAGHCTFIYGHNDVGVFDGTWGMEGTIPWDALAYYFGGKTGELYAVVGA